MSDHEETATAWSSPQPALDAPPEGSDDRAETPPSAFSRKELIQALYRPNRLMDITLASPTKLALSIREVKALPVVVLFMLTGWIFAMPYSAVEDVSQFWRVPLLFLGSLVICFPSMHVIGTYLGFRSTIHQSLALALLIPAVAAVFSFGFFPVLWFLEVTMVGSSTGRDAITINDLSFFLLAVSLFAGIVHQQRVLNRELKWRQVLGYPVFLVFWQMLLLFISYRMAIVLELV